MATALEDELDRLALLMQAEFFADTSRIGKEDDGHNLDERYIPAPFMPPPYTYTPIPSTSTVIRVLVLAAGSESDPLSAELVFKPMSKRTTYEALSYVWGDPTKTHVLEVSGGHLPITTSLDGLLRRVRLKDKARTLWADAVCINQQDAAEKSHQVLSMSTIYSNAQHVLCWLGPDSPDHDIATAVDILRRIQLAGPIYDLNDLRTWAVEENLPEFGDRRWRSFGYLFTRPWFKRRWILQEFVKARSAILIAGSLEVHWVDITEGINRSADYGLLSWAFDDDDHENYKLTFDGNMAFHSMLRLKQNTGPLNARTLREIRERRRRYYTVRDEISAEVENFIKSMPQELIDGMIAILNWYAKVDENDVSGESYQLFLSKQKLYLAEVLMEVRFSQVSDARDCFYALLGMVEEGKDPAFKPDYKLSASEVFERCVRRIFQITPPSTVGKLLSLAGICNHHGKVILPSWMPDWSDTGTLRDVGVLVAQGSVSFSTYQAGGGADLAFRFKGEDLNRLVLRGHVISLIHETVPSPFAGHEELECTTSATKKPRSSARKKLEFMRKYFFAIDAIAVGRQHPYPYITPPDDHLHEPQTFEHELEIIWRTLIGNTANGQRLQNAADMEASYLDLRCSLPLYLTKEQWRLARVRNSLDNPSDANEKHWLSLWRSASGFYNFAVLENGMFGMMPRASQPGDQICVIPGCPAPLVLRSVTENDRSDAFQLIGGAYVHGLMDGEAIEWSGWEEQEIHLV